MASKRSNKPRALNVVNQEFKDPETRLKLMAQTDFELPLSDEQTEEPKKYTRSKRENTGEILDAFHIVVKTAESERELEIVRNEKRTLELEILEKKLQLQRMMLRCPEVLRIPPVKPTPLHGCFKDHTRNHQDFATLETLRTRQNSTTKLPLLPHYLVMSNKGMSEYQHLNISEFVCGYIEKVKLYPKIQEDLYAHLQLLIGKAMTYSWNCVKTFHLDGTCDFFVRARSHVVETTKCNHWKGQ